MVYPGEEKVNVVLDPGNIACLRILPAVLPQSRKMVSTELK